MYLASISNEAKVYLENLYPACFEDAHDETNLGKSKRLYKKGTKFRSLLSETDLIFDREPVFREKDWGIYEYYTGYLVFDKDKGWAEIIEL